MNSLYKRIVTIGMISFTAVLAWIYCVLEYRTEPVYIVGVSLVLVVSLYALLNAFIGLRIEKENKLRNYIDNAVATTTAKLEQGQDNTELERLNKAIYVQLRKSNTLLAQMLETDSKQSVQNTENYAHIEEMTKLVAESINKAVKIIVKYNQNNHDGMVSALSDLSSGLERIGREINQAKDEIANIKIDIPEPQYTTQETVHASDESAETPDLNSFFNEFGGNDTYDISDNTAEPSVEASSVDLNNNLNDDASESPTEDSVADSNQKLSQDEIAALFEASKEERKAKSDDDFQIHEHPEAMSQDLIDALLANNTDSSDTTNDADIIPFPTKDAAQESDPNRQLTPDEIAALFASAAGTSTDDNEPDTSDSPSETGSESEQDAQEESTDSTISATNDDPNRQLTPDEIAALFASMQ